jgi:hypothetical protein
MSEETDGGNTSTSSEISPEIRNKALAGGWTDKEHWKGSPEEWVDADVFVKRGDEWLGNVRKQNEALKRDLDLTKTQMRELREATEEFKKFQRDSYNKKVADLNTRMQEIKAERAKAISDGDGTKVNDLDDALEAAKEEVREAKVASDATDKPTKTQPAPSSEITPELETWMGNNKWFGSDRRLTAIANGVGESLRLEFPTLRGQDFLDKLDEVLQEEMPSKFGIGKKPRNVPSVEGGGGRQPRGARDAKSYENLPSDAKAACDRFVKQKLMTREQYVQEYSWD